MESKVTAKGQIVIPAALRRKYGISAGTKIQFYEENDRIILQPVTREYIDKVRGMFKGSGALKALMEDRKRERER
jgi:AbrB family looped-hinge helix DNA binding protein